MAGTGPRRTGYDAVIVGGGHNGLIAAAYLARAGRRCLLLERLPGLGGAAVSERAFAGVDARLSRYSYLVSLMPQRILAELDLDLTLRRRRISSYTPDPRAAAERGLLVDAGDRAASRASFLRVTGEEREHAAWEAFYAMTARVASTVFPTLTEPLPSRARLRALIADEPAWTALFERPLGDTVGEVFHDDLVAGVVLTDALIGTFADADDAQLLQNRCFLYHVIGGGTGEWLVPVGGMGALSEALVAAARSAGAELRTGAEALALTPLPGAGVDVAFREEGREREVRAAHVLFAAAPAELDRLLARGGGSEGAPAAEPEGSQLKVNLLLSRLPRLREGGLAPERAFAGTFHVNEMASQLRRAHAQAAGGEIPELPPCEAYCHSLTDPSILGPALRRSGAQTLTVFALHMPRRLFARDPEHAREAALRATLRSLDSVLAEPLEDCLLRDRDGAFCIEARSPEDLREELRMPGGHIFHRDLAWPYAESEDEVGTWGVQTTQPSISLCGAGARRGGGVSGIPGRNAAMALLRGAPAAA